MTYRDELTTERDDLAERIKTMRAAQSEKEMLQVAESQYGRDVPLTQLRARVSFLIARDVDRVAELDVQLKRIAELKTPPPPRAEIEAAVNELRRLKYRWPTHDELERELGRALPAGVMAYINSATTSSRFLN